MLFLKAALLNILMKRPHLMPLTVQRRYVIFVQVWEKNMNDVIEILKEYSNTISSNIGNFTGILYGSMARGDNNVWSDIDFLVISDKLPDNPLERLEFLYSLTEIPIEVKGYTRNEFLRMIEKRNPLALDALVEGQIILDDGFWKIAKNKFEETKKKYELIRKKKRWISMSMRRNLLDEMMIQKSAPI